MTAPKTIWLADPENGQEFGRRITTKHTALPGTARCRPLIEYRRADLPATDAQIMAHPSVAALVEAVSDQLAYMDLCHDVGDLHRNLTAALAAMPGVPE